MIRLRQVQPGEASGIWAEAEPHLARACAYGNGEHTPDTMLRMIEREQAQLWIGQEAGKVVYAGVTHVVEYPTGYRVCELMAVGGRRMDEWARPHLDAVERWAEMNGCDATEMIGRPGWQKKLPGYRLRHVKLIKDLRHDSQKCA